INPDQWFAPSLTALVNSIGQQFLSGSGFTENQDCRVSGSDDVNLMQQATQRYALAYYPGKNDFSARFVLVMNCRDQRGVLVHRFTLSKNPGRRVAAFSP